MYTAISPTCVRAEQSRSKIAHKIADDIFITDGQWASRAKHTRRVVFNDSWKTVNSADCNYFTA